MATRVPQVRARAFHWKARPPTHSMRVVVVCSATAARGAAFVRPHCRPRFTEVHSAAACASPAQSTSAALIGYDGTTLFHHTAYAASYTARSAMLQATPQATPWRCFDKTGHGYAGRRIPAGRARKSRNEISFVCNAIMYEQYVIFILHRLGPPVGDPTAMYTPPLRYKREALAAHTKLPKLSQTLSRLRERKQYNTQWT